MDFLRKLLTFLGIIKEDKQDDLIVPDYKNINNTYFTSANIEQFEKYESKKYVNTIQSKENSNNTNLNHYLGYYTKASDFK